MKIDSRITEERKVRCTGCRIVILLTPDDEEPDGMHVSIPKKSDKPKGMSESRKRVLLMGVLLILAILVGVGLWYSLAGPQDRWPVSGEVSLDGAPLIKGTIEFSTVDAAKPITTSIGIVQGRYSLRAGFGKNKVKVTGAEGTNVHARFSGDDTKLSAEIGKGDNTHNFDVFSK